jgi:cytochrome P450
MPTVAEILSDPAYVVPPPPPAGPVGTVSWLRATVCRFSEGETHARRRALVERRLAGIDPERLQALTAAGASPVRALAGELGLGDVEAAVSAVAAVYLTGEPSPEADAAVATLVAACGPGDEEAVAADIAILVQAANATAALIAGADPPVPATRRLGPDGLVTLDLTGLPFGAGRHRCPGEAHARALAAGALSRP